MILVRQAWSLDQLSKRLAWSLGANALASITVFVSALLSARWLGPVAFGRLSLLLSAQVVLTTAISSSLGQVATKLTAELQHTDPRRLDAIRMLLRLAIRAFCGVIFVGGMVAPSLVNEIVLGAGAESSLTRIAVPTVLFAVLTSLQQGHMAGVGAFRGLAWINALRLVATLVLLGLLTPTLGLKGAIIALGVAGAVTWVASEFELRRHIAAPSGVAFSQARKELRVLTGFALPSWLSGVLFAAAAWCGNVLLSRRPDGLLQVGLFGAANQMGRSILLLVPNALAVPFLVEIASVLGRGDNQAARGLFRRSLLLTSASTVLPALGVALLGRTLLGLYGPAFVSGYALLLVILAATVMAGLTLSVNTTLLAFGQAWSVTLVTTVWATVFLLTMWTMRGEGAMSLGIAYLAGYAAQVALTVPLTVRLLYRGRHA